MTQKQKKSKENPENKCKIKIQKLKMTSKKSSHTFTKQTQ